MNAREKLEAKFAEAKKRLGLNSEYGYSSEYSEEEDRLLKESDDEAKANKTLVGRYYKESVADGEAIYVIVQANRTHCLLHHLKWVDGYRCFWIDQMRGVVPRHIVEENIRLRELTEDYYKQSTKGM